MVKRINYDHYYHAGEKFRKNQQNSRECVYNKVVILFYAQCNCRQEIFKLLNTNYACPKLD